jgi:predicted DNA-binding protein
MTSEKSLISEPSRKIKSYTTNQFVARLEDLYEPAPKGIHVFFHHESLKKSTIDVCYMKPVLFVLEIGKTKKFVSAKELNEKLGHDIAYINLRKGIENKINQLKHLYYSLNILIEKRIQGEYEYYPTSRSYVNDKSLIEKIKLADEELFHVVEFEL